jgi:hypothetical protein
MMVWKYPEYRKRQEAAKREREKSDYQSDRQQIIGALKTIAQHNDAANNQAKRADRFNRLAEKLSFRFEGRRLRVDISGIIGIYLAAFVAIWAVLMAKCSSDDQYQAMMAQQRSMQGQLNIMKADWRPWLSMDTKVTTPLHFDNSGAHVGLDETVENHGKSVAKFVQMIESGLQVQDITPYGRSIQTNQVMTNFLIRANFIGQCDIRNVAQFTAGFGHFIFPGQGQHYHTDMGADRSAFTHHRDDNTSVWFAICIAYRDDAGSPHGTLMVFAYENQSGAIIFPTEGVVQGKFVTMAADGY